MTFDERPELDLAIVTIDDREPSRSGHRFGHDRFDGLHPMALHHATDRFRLFLIHGRSYRSVDRYETWVQYTSRPTLPRVDLRPLAEESTALESGATRWSAGAPTALAPELAPDGESSLVPGVVTDRIVATLATGRSPEE